ncbi:MAG TPA: hypothetical protein PL029_08055 [Bacteroidia bacterium]|nr:hypothetical protein [Bacteroidia bacterium]
MNKVVILLLTVLVLLFCGCGNNTLDVDISGVQTAPLNVLRLEQDLFSLNPSNFNARSKEVKIKYGAYFEHYLMNFLNRGGTGDSLYQPNVLAYIHDKDVKEAKTYIDRIYPDEKINEIAAEANDCVKRFHFHFPKRKLPARLVTCMSGWNYAFAYLDSVLVLSLDMYLGDTAKFYQMLRYPQYQARKMNERYILPDLTRGWMLTEFDNSLPVNNLLNHTIFYGKIFYAVNALLPNENDSMIIGYTKKQMDYCRTYEKNIWSYFAEKNRLYENSLQTVRELTTEGPFTGAISKECPPRIAMWIGWQIIKSYMKNNKDATLEQLMAETDAQKILSKSKYRP